MKSQRKLIYWAIFSAMLLAPIATACGTSQPAAAPTTAPAAQAPAKVATGPGVTDTTINLGMLPDLTGPSSQMGIPVNEGTLAYFNYINDKGGVKGRKLVAVSEDYAYDMNKGLVAYNRMKGNVLAFALAHGGNMAGALREPLAADKIPTMVNATAASSFNPVHPYIFAMHGTLQDQEWATIAYTIKRGEKGKRFVTMSNEGPSFDGLVVGLQEAAKKYEVVNAGDIKFPATTTDFSSYVQRVLQLRPDYIQMAVVGANDNPIQRELARVGWKGTYLKAGAGFDDAYFQLAADGNEVLAASAYANSDMKVPGVQEQFDILSKQMGAQKAKQMQDNGPFQLGWHNAKGLVAALQNAKDLTRESLLEELQKLKLDTAGMTGPAVISPKVHFGLRYNFIGKANYATKKWEIVSDFIKSEDPQFD